MSSMDRRERVAAALGGGVVDRPPVSFWGHDFLREWTAEGLAAAMLESVATYSYDYLKVNPRASYYVEAWGCRFTPSNDAARGPNLEHWILNEPRDLNRVEPVDAASGPFGEQLAALRMIGAGLAGEVPFVQTVFSPLSVVGRMAQDRTLVRTWMSEAPDVLRAALEAVTETLSAYARLSVEGGADGIFFPTTEWGSHDACTDDEYAAFGRPYDLRVLKAVEGAEFNILHVCRPHNMLDQLLDYPAAAVNWDIHGEGNDSLANVVAKTDKAVMGGVDVDSLLNGTAGTVRAEVDDAIRQTDGRRLLIAPGCSISPQTPPANLHAAVDAARATGE